MTSPLSPSSQAFIEMLEKQLASEGATPAGALTSGYNFGSFSPDTQNAGKGSAFASMPTSLVGQSLNHMDPNYLANLQRLHEMIQSAQKQTQPGAQGAGVGADSNNESDNQRQNSASSVSTTGSGSGSNSNSTAATSVSSSGSAAANKRASSSPSSGSPSSSGQPQDAPSPASATRAAQKYLHDVAMASFMGGISSNSPQGIYPSLRPGNVNRALSSPMALMPFYGTSRPSEIKESVPNGSPTRTTSDPKGNSPKQHANSNTTQSSSSPPTDANHRNSMDGNAAASRTVSPTEVNRRHSSLSSNPNAMPNGAEVDMDHKRKADDEDIEGHLHHRSRTLSGATDSRRRNSKEHDPDSEAEDSEDFEPSKRKGSTSRRKGTNGASSRKDDELAYDYGHLDDAEARALKRKNQNRAAQKAFRERREQKVKDLEDKVKELEAKSYGQSIENDNLRQLLSKLQQENMSLRNSAFTFSMPIKGVSPSASRDSPPNSADTPVSDAGKPVHPNGHSKNHLPSPPLSLNGTGSSGDRNSVSSTHDSPSNRISPGESADMTSSGVNTSASDQRPIFHPDPYNAFDNKSASNSTSAPQQRSTPQSGDIQSAQPFDMNATDVQSVFAALNNRFMFGFDVPANQQPPEAPPVLKPESKMSDSSPMTSAAQAYQANAQPWTMLLQDPEFMSFPESTDNPMNGSNFSQSQDLQSTATGGLTSANQWVVDASSLAAFLNQVPEGGSGNGVIADDQFMKPQGAPDSSIFNPYTPLQPLDENQAANDLFSEFLFGNSAPPMPSSSHDSFGSATQRNSSLTSDASPFNSSNYWTVSPENTMSGLAPTPTPASGSSYDSAQNRGHAGGTYLSDPAGKGNCDQARVIRADGTAMTAAQLWEKVHSKVDFSNGFDLDELCDRFKASASCSGYGPVLEESAMDEVIDRYVQEKKQVTYT